MLAGCESLGVQTWPIDIGTAVRPLRPDAALPEGVPLAIHVNAPTLPLALLRLPRGLLRGRRVIGCWAWELPVASPEWRPGAAFVHEAWLPSRFTAAAIEPLLPGRVRVVGYPAAVAPPVPSALGRADFGLPEEAVIVLTSFSLASSFERKNPLAAVAAFRAAFGGRTDRLLVLKVAEPAGLDADMAQLRAAIAGVPNIRLETRALPAGDNAALIRAVDIVLSLHRSEGFGLAPAEAMLLGRAVVATDWSGSQDFLTRETAALVDAALIPARDPRGVFEAPGAVWADPDVAQAAAHLRRLADDPRDRAALGAAGLAAALRLMGTGPLSAALRGLGLEIGG
jgi:glycosyltransferase involved in cell wall biosynthesis